MKEKTSEKFIIVAVFVVLVLVPLLGALFASSSSVATSAPTTYIHRPNPTPWQLVTVEDIGSFYVPGHWVITQQDDVIYMTDKPIDEEDYTIYFVGVVYTKPRYSDRNKVLQDILGEFSCLSRYYYMMEPTIGPKVWSRDTFEVAGFEVEHFVIELGYPHSLYMIAWDNAVEVSTVRRMMVSFSASDEDN
jgi:hypothetical protein